MATVVETGAIVSGANSYISDEDFETYASDRGITVSGTASQLLLQAMTYVENLDFLGFKTAKANPLQWPRNGVYIDNYSIDSNEIPQQLIDLQCEVALAIDAGNDPLSTVERSVKREKVDVIEREYMDNAVPFAINRKISTLKRKLVRSGGGGLSFRIDRA